MAYGPNLQRFWDAMPEDEKQAVEARAKELREEYLTLQELRLAIGLTQERLSQELGMKQDRISRLIKESDLLLSTLRELLMAVGGQLHLVVELPGKPPIKLDGIGDLVVSDTTSANRKQKPNKDGVGKSHE